MSEFEKNGLIVRSTKLSIGRFLGLTAAGIGIGAICGTLRPTNIAKLKGDQLVQSPYFATAVDTVHKRVKNQDIRRKIIAILEDTDNQGISNFSVYNSSKFPGVKFPVTSVNLNRFLGLIFQSDQTQPIEPSKESEFKRVYLVMPGFSWPRAGHPFTPWDIVYDRVFRALPKIARAKASSQTLEQTEIIILGSPNSWWGSVTPEWVDQLKTNGLSPYSNLYSEYLDTQLLPENRAKTSLILQGISLGAAVAKFTSEELANLKPQLASIRLRMDNPVGLTSLPNLSQVQIILGFLGEGTARTIFTNRGKAIARDEGPFYKVANKVLSERGIIPNDQDFQTSLKETAAKTDIINLLHGSKPQPGDQVRSYSTQGVYDPLSFSLDRLSKACDLKSAGKNPIISLPNGLEVLTGSTHFVDRIRVKKWAASVDLSQKTLSNPS